MKKGFLILIFIILISIIIYAFLGGFKSIEKTIEEDKSIHIAGIEYVGKVGSDSLQMLFMQSKKLVETEEKASSIAIVYYNEADEKTGDVHNFIGVVSDDASISNMPKNWELRTFERKASVKGCIEANVLAMPTPEDMLEELKSYASEKNIETDSIFIEYYPGPNQLCVEILATKERI
jgi:hypothetical protein